MICPIIPFSTVFFVLLWQATNGKTRSITVVEPCAEVAALYERWNTTGGHGNMDGIAGETALNCIRSMPLYPAKAVQFIEDYSSYLQFHSTLDDLKRPPDGYISSSVDLTKGLKRILNRAKNGLYTTQFDFDRDLTALISRAFDGHLQIGLCSQEIMFFEHNIALVSISEDGLQLPLIYTYDDAQSKFYGHSQVSSVVEIDNVDAPYYLQAHVAVNFGFQDPDARYNHLFPSAVAGFLGFHTGGAWTTYEGRWPGTAAHTLQFANGTHLQVNTTASWRSTNGPMIYVSGGALYDATCRSNTSSKFGTYSRSPFALPAYAVPPSGPAAFPQPTVRHSQDFIRGYYLNEGTFKDVAVLQVPTFRVQQTAREFAEVASKFIKQAAAEGKKRLIIDLSGNYGGDVNVGFHLSRVLFPDQLIYSATRFRATKLIDLMGRVFSQVGNLEEEVDLPLVFDSAVGPGQEKDFQSWNDLYGPHRLLNSNLSSLYAVFKLDIASTSEDPIGGFGGIPIDPATQLFKPRDIIIITDGRCASTCAIFAGLLKKQGVRSIAFGGRPRLTPMQTVGGVRGGQSWSLSTISQHISHAYELALNASRMGKPILSIRELELFKELAPPSTENFTIRFNTYLSSSVNFRNTYAENDDITPLQFVYEAADCRRFYTANNYVHPASIWVAASEAMFEGGACI